MPLSPHGQILHPIAKSSVAPMLGALDLSDQNVALVLAGIFQAVLSHSKTASQCGLVQQTVPDVDRSTINFLELDQVAPCYGELKSEAVRHMDEELKVAVAGTARAISVIPPEGRTWSAIMEVLKQSPVLEPCVESEVDRAETYTSDRKNWMKSTPEYSSVVKEVRAWLTKLIVDPDIIKQRAEVDLELVSKIVAHAGNTIHGLRVFQKESGEQKVLDIGLLRYPDVENPFIKVYRIELLAWYDSRVVVGRAHDHNGISGQFNVRSFKPRAEIIRCMRHEAKQMAISEADNLFMSPKK